MFVCVVNWMVHPREFLVVVVCVKMDETTSGHLMILLHSRGWHLTRVD